MIIFNNDLSSSSFKNIVDLYGITGKSCSELSRETIELIKHEYWLAFNNPNAVSEINMINQQYNDKVKVLSLGKRK